MSEFKKTAAAGLSTSHEGAQAAIKTPNIVRKAARAERLRANLRRRKQGPTGKTKPVESGQ